MISKDFYNSKNLVRQYLGGKVYHYPIKDKSITLQDYNYRFVGGDTVYSVALKTFGDGLDYLWPFLTDNNSLRHQDDWTMGDFFRLPKLILKDTDTLSTIYTNAAPSTTPI